jgi:hypothetical protein
MGEGRLVHRQLMTYMHALFTWSYTNNTRDLSSGRPPRGQCILYRPHLADRDQGYVQVYSVIYWWLHGRLKLSLRPRGTWQQRDGPVPLTSNISSI